MRPSEYISTRSKSKIVPKRVIDYSEGVSCIDPGSTKGCEANKERSGLTYEERRDILIKWLQGRQRLLLEQGYEGWC